MKLPSMSSRENPKVICVRSFVPNEKNSATSAISSATSAARGVSTIVPIWKSTPPISEALANVASATSRTHSIASASSGLRHRERDHDLDARVAAGELRARSPLRAAP